MEFDFNKVLPLSLRVKNAECVLYSYGISHYRPENAKKRKLIYNPTFSIVVYIMFLLRFTFSLFLPNGNEELRIWMGDFAYFMRLKVHLNISFILCIIFCLSVNFIHLYNHYN